jgi:hypothetical protein
MFGTIKSIETSRGVIWIQSCGLNGGTLPALMDTESCAKFEVGQSIVYGEGKLAVGVRAPRDYEVDRTAFGASITVEPDGQVIK